MLYIIYITGKEFEMNKCKQCSKETKNKLFCSRSCSASFNNKGVRRHGSSASKCLNCEGKTRRSINKFCSNSCQQDYQYKEYIKRWLDNEENGMAGEGVSARVKRWLIENRGEKCEECGWNEVNQKTGLIPITVDHIDGNYENNRPENLKLLCPNHHSLTPTYGSLNRGRGRKERKKRRNFKKS